MKKIFSLFAVVFMAMGMFAADYVKVTETPADWAGEYVLVCETQATPYAFTGVDAALGSEAVTITNGVIQNYTGVTLTIAALADGGYSVMVNGGTNDGKYISSGSSAPTYSNALKFVTTATRVDLAYEDSAVKMYQVIGPDSVVSMRFNKAADQLRFRFYKSGQEPVQLYRLLADTTGGSDPVTPGAGITYELNGGVANTYGWTTPDEMFATFMTESGATDFSTLAEYKALAEPLGAPAGICAKLNNPENCFADTAKWGWLMTYIMSVHAAQAAEGASSLAAAGSGAAWRYAVGAFFIDGQRASWPKSANFATCGVSTYGAYSAVWQNAFANPTNPTGTFTLNEPYKANNTFDGWYAAADFSGAKVTTVDSTTTGTLYAKWIEYIPTLAEVKAMADNTNTKASGVVTYINGKNVYVQDATGGLLLYMKANPTFNVGDKVVVSGMKVMYGGAPELKNGVEVSAEASTLPAAAPYESLASACTEGNLFTRVSFMGLKITSLDSYNNPYVTDGVDTLQCYRMSVDSTFKVGDKVNITAILGYYNKYQLVGDVAGIEHIMLGVKDQYNYPARGANGEYTLENKWVISVTEDNYEANKPGVTGFVRGMAAKDGIMYFINRTLGAIIPVNGTTAEMLDPIVITGEHLFEALDTTDNSYKAAVTLAFNDIKFDGAGNCLIGACISGSQHFMIYKVDLTTGAATLLIDEKLVDNDNFATIADDGSRSWGGRFDAFGVYGDVNSDAIVMAADANSFYAYKWTISNGVAGAAEQIDCAPDPSSDQSLLIKDGAVSVTNFGTAPQIFPVDADYFYVDGWNTLPMLYDMDGMLADDFINSPSGVNVVNNEGDTCKMNVGHNGICEFQVGDDYFMVMAATNTVGTPASAFALYKFANSSKSFSGIEPLWYFPANGMGSATNGFRTAVPSVEVNGNKATIYLYAGDNGYGVYEFTGKEAGPTVIENLYEIGDNQGWKPAEGIAMTKTAENVFKGEFTFTAATSYFAFTTVQSDNWDLVNANRFGGAENNQLVADGTVAPLAAGELCLTIAPGTYNITVDLNAMTATVEAVATGLENTEAGNVTKIVENGQVYIIKNGVRYNVLGTTVEK
ncbi:MAG: hypothetical protein MST03_00185 [Bacteroidales bacterium]|nr:hypothetical protein [Bacteroidales bacterium]